MVRLLPAVVGYKGGIVYDMSRPDGPPQKPLDISKIGKLGRAPKIKLRDGLAQAYADFLATGGRRNGSRTRVSRRAV